MALRFRGKLWHGMVLVAVAAGVACGVAGHLLQAALVASGILLTAGFLAGRRLDPQGHPRMLAFLLSAPWLALGITALLNWSWQFTRRVYGSVPEPFDSSSRLVGVALYLLGAVALAMGPGFVVGTLARSRRSSDPHGPDGVPAAAALALGWIVFVLLSVNLITLLNRHVG
jgi:hypothetical protein